MENQPQSIHITQRQSPFEEVLKAVRDDAKIVLESKYIDRMLTNFFHELEEFIVPPRYVDFITKYNLTQYPEFQQLLEKKLTTILQLPAILSDDGWDLQNFLIILATYEEVFREVRLPASTAEVLRNRIEFLRANGQSAAMIDRLTLFLPKH